MKAINRIDKTIEEFGMVVKQMCYGRLTFNNGYVKFTCKAERQWLRVLRLDVDVDVGSVWNHPVNLGLRFGPDVIDNMCNINEDR